MSNITTIEKQLDADFVKATIAVNDKVKQPNGEYGYRQIGAFECGVPTLPAVVAVLAAADLTAIDAEATEKNEGVPVYKDEKANWLQKAIFAQVKAQARNRLKPKTADLKDGRSLPATWADLLEELTGSGNGEALKAVADARKAFAAWLPTTGKSEKAQVQLAKFFVNRSALELQPAAIKEKIAVVIASFVESLSAEDADRFGRYLESLADACQSEELDADDF